MSAIRLVPTRLASLLILSWLVIPALFAADKPNIIVIVSDDAGYNEFSMNGGNPLFPTPHIDSIAANGVQFTSG